MDVEALRAAARAVEPPLDEPELEAVPSGGDILLDTFVESMTKIAGKTAAAITDAFDKTWEEVSGESCPPGVGYVRLYERMTDAFREAAAKMVAKAPELSPAARLAKEAAVIAGASGISVEEATRAIVEMGKIATAKAAAAKTPPFIAPEKLDAALVIDGYIVRPSDVREELTIGGSRAIEFAFTPGHDRHDVALIAHNARVNGRHCEMRYKGRTFNVDHEFIGCFADAHRDGILCGFTVEESEPGSFGRSLGRTR